MKRIWRSGENYLVDLDGRVFCIVDKTGAITYPYRNSVEQVDDWGYNIWHFVEETELRCRNQAEYLYGDSKSDTVTVVLRDLRLDETSDTRAFITQCFADAEVSREDERMRIARAAEARVAAIAGARRDHGMGEAFARAQQALVAHVHDSDDPLYAALLRTLIAMTRVKENRVAIGEYIRACLLACFAANVPDETTEAGVSTPLPTLADELLARAAELDVRANRGSRQHGYAAEAARRAAALLR